MTGDIRLPAFTQAGLATLKTTNELTRSLARPLYWLYEKKLYEQVAAARKPQHLGLILDGNRRFARAMGMNEQRGYEHGVRKVHEVLHWCVDLGIPHVTVYVLSTENFRRSSGEVSFLLDLFVKKSREFSRPDVAVKVIGRRHMLPEEVLETVRTLEAEPVEEPRLKLNIALAYGGREEIVDAVRGLIHEAGEKGDSLSRVADQLTPGQIAQHLYTSGLPDPDFIIRTSGEQRLSG